MLINYSLYNRTTAKASFKSHLIIGLQIKPTLYGIKIKHKTWCITFVNIQIHDLMKYLEINYLWGHNLLSNGLSTVSFLQFMDMRYLSLIFFM